MARPQKAGLDYFPLDVDMDQDDKIQLIEAQFGITGFGIIVKLFMKIYKEGYYYKWTEKEQLIFSWRINEDINTLNDVINECLKRGLLSKEMYDGYRILTSKGIQKRYIKAVNKRKKIEIIKQYCLINIEDYINAVIVDINSVNVNINLASEVINNDINTNSSVNINPQNKVKESKEKKSKEKKDYFPEIENFRQRYSSEQLITIDQYLEILRTTRVSGKIVDSVIFKIYEEMNKYPTVVVEYACSTVINHPDHHSKKENYFFGIMRNTSADEAVRKLRDYNIRAHPNNKSPDFGEDAEIM